MFSAITEAKTAPGKGTRHVVRLFDDDEPFVVAESEGAFHDALAKAAEQACAKLGREFGGLLVRHDSETGVCAVELAAGDAGFIGGGNEVLAATCKALDAARAN